MSKDSAGDARREAAARTLQGFARVHLARDQVQLDRQHNDLRRLVACETRSRQSLEAEVDAFFSTIAPVISNITLDRFIEAVLELHVVFETQRRERIEREEDSARLWEIDDVAKKDHYTLTVVAASMYVPPPPVVEEPPPPPEPKRNTRNRRGQPPPPVEKPPTPPPPEPVPLAIPDTDEALKLRDSLVWEEHEGRSAATSEESSGWKALMEEQEEGRVAIAEREPTAKYVECELPGELTSLLREAVWDASTSLRDQVAAKEKEARAALMQMRRYSRDNANHRCEIRRNREKYDAATKKLRETRNREPIERGHKEDAERRNRENIVRQRKEGIDRIVQANQERIRNRINTCVKDESDTRSNIEMEEALTFKENARNNREGAKAIATLLRRREVAAQAAIREEADVERRNLYSDERTCRYKLIATFNSATNELKRTDAARQARAAKQREEEEAKARAEREKSCQTEFGGGRNKRRITRLTSGVSYITPEGATLSRDRYHNLRTASPMPDAVKSRVTETALKKGQDLNGVRPSGVLMAMRETVLSHFHDTDRAMIEAAENRLKLRPIGSKKKPKKSKKDSAKGQQENNKRGPETSVTPATPRKEEEPDNGTEVVPPTTSPEETQEEEVEEVPRPNPELAQLEAEEGDVRGTILTAEMMSRSLLDARLVELITHRKCDDPKAVHSLKMGRVLGSDIAATLLPAPKLEMKYDDEIDCYRDDPSRPPWEIVGIDVLEAAEEELQTLRRAVMHRRQQLLAAAATAAETLEIARRGLAPPENNNRSTESSSPSPLPPIRKPKGTRSSTRDDASTMSTLSSARSSRLPPLSSRASSTSTTVSRQSLKKATRDREEPLQSFYGVRSSGPAAAKRRVRKAVAKMYGPSVTLSDEQNEEPSEDPQGDELNKLLVGPHGEQHS